MASAYDLYSSIVNAMMPGFSQPKPQPPASAPPASQRSPYLSPNGDRIFNYPGVRNGAPLGRPDDGMTADLSFIRRAMERAREQEIAERNGNQNLTAPQSGASAMNDPNSMTPAMGAPTSGPMPAQRSGGFQLSPANGGGVLANAPMPPSRPNAATPAMFNYEDSNGLLRQFMAKDGKAPNLPGMTVTPAAMPSADTGSIGKILSGLFM